MLEKTTDAKPAIAKLYEERTTRIITTLGLHKALGALLADGYHSFVSDGHIWALPRGLAQIDAIDGWESGWQHGNLKNGVLTLHLTYPAEASGDQVMYALHDFAAEVFSPLDTEDSHEFITCQKRTKDGYLARVLVNRRGSDGAHELDLHANRDGRGRARTRHQHDRIPRGK